MSVVVYANASDKEKRVKRERIIKKNTLSKSTCSYADKLIHDVMDSQSIFEGVALMDGDKVRIRIDKQNIWVSLLSRVLPIWGSCYEVEDCLSRKDYSEYSDFFNEIASTGTNIIEFEIVNGKVSNINRVLKNDGSLRVVMGKDFNISSFQDTIEEDWDLVCIGAEDTGVSGLPYTVLSDIYLSVLNFIKELYIDFDGSESYIVRILNKEDELGLYFSVEGNESFIVFNKDIGKVVSLSSDEVSEEYVIKYSYEFLKIMKRYLKCSSYIEVIFDGLTWKRCRSLSMSKVFYDSEGFKIKILG